MGFNNKASIENLNVNEVNFNVEFDAYQHEDDNGRPYVEIDCVTSCVLSSNPEIDFDEFMHANPLFVTQIIEAIEREPMEEQY